MIGQMPNQVPTQEEELKKLIEKNLELTEEIYKMTKGIKSFISFQKFMSFVYFLIIVVPIVLSIIYLPPLLGGIIKQYQDLLGTGSNSGVTDILKGGVPSLNGLDLKNLNLEKLKAIQPPVNK